MRLDCSMLRLCEGAALALLLTACPAPPSDVGSDGSGSSDTGTTGVDTNDPGATSVVSGQTSVGTSPSTTSVDPDSSDGMDSMGFISGGTTSGGPVGDLPNGGFCGMDEECQSGHCLAIDGVGGVCSECEIDSDCAMGTCVFDIGIGYSACTDGGVGVDCMSDDGCADGLVCVDVFDAGGFSPLRCSECGPDAPCPDGQGCVLITDNGLLEAYLGCVDAGTVPLGETCPVVGGVGDGATCMSGECGVISVFGGAVEIGVCSECDADADCPVGQTCSPPDFSMGMLLPGTCG